MPHGARRSTVGQPARFVQHDIVRLKRRVGITDRVRVDQHFDSVREIDVRSSVPKQGRREIICPIWTDRWVSLRRSPTT